MKFRNLAAMIAVCAFGAAAWAMCPPEKSASDQKATVSKVELTSVKAGCCAKAKKVQTASTDSPCPFAKGAKTASSNGPCPHATAVQTASQKPGCCGNCKNAKAASSDGPCPHATKVQTASAGSGCNKSKGVTTASQKPGCCAKAKGVTTASAGSGCPKAAKMKAVLASLPTMTYKVGDKSTSCDKSAGAMAKENGSKVQYVVGENTYAEEGEATVQLAKLLDDQVAKMQTIQFSAGGKCYACPVTAKSMVGDKGGKIAYRVGGVDFETKALANKALENIKVALAKVEMSYTVGDKAYKCGTSAGKVAKAGTAKLTYVVGDKSTCCKIQAGVLLAQAKIRTIVETAIQTS